MRIILTADLHYDFERDRPAVEALAADVCRQEADVLVVAGDTFALDLGLFIRCLRLFEPFAGPKLLVAGNHDLWTTSGDSFDLYDRILPEAASACGFHDLDAGEHLIDDVAFVGTIGWYDYSFRDQAIGVPMRFYEHKVAPGYALQHLELTHLVADATDIPPRAFAARSSWMDGKMIRWNLDDPSFTQITLDRLAAQLAAVGPHARAIVAVTHHIPFAGMLRRKSDPSWAFGNAFMGSVGLGEVLLRHPKVSHAVCGHSHTRDRLRVGHVEARNVGCTYRRKRYDVVEV